MDLYSQSESTRIASDISRVLYYSRDRKRPFDEATNPSGERRRKDIRKDYLIIDANSSTPMSSFRCRGKRFYDASDIKEDLVISVTIGDIIFSSLPPASGCHGVKFITRNTAPSVFTCQIQCRFRNRPSLSRKRDYCALDQVAKFK